MRSRFRLTYTFVICLSLLLSACAPIFGQEATQTPRGLRKPGEPVYQQVIYDCNTGKQAEGADLIQPDSGCDSWQLNRYERPFNAQTQDTFYPDLDLLSAEIGQQGDWLFFRLNIFDVNQDSGRLDGTYAIEFDLDIDGRGDVLLLVQAPGDDAIGDWSIANVQFLGDGNNDVGDDQPLAPDPPNQADGYDTLVFDSGEGEAPDLAWARLQPGKPAKLELALQYSAIRHDPIFKWWAWSDQGVDNPSGADYHDTFDHPEAGDPIQGMAFFPSQAINELDNTCASIWGAPPSEDPELCENDPSVPPPSRQPSATPSGDGSPTPTNDGSPTPTPTEPSETRTPTPTEPNETHTPSPTPTDCVPSNLQPTTTLTPQSNGQTGANNPAGAPTTTTTTTITPGVNDTATPSATPTRPPQLEDCTPTPSPSPTPCFTYQQSPNESEPQIFNCTPTPSYTATPTDCIVPYDFAVIPCTPTPTLTFTATATRCLTEDSTGQTQDCTPTPSPTVTPTLCVDYSSNSTALIPCTPTPTPTQCISSATGAAAVPCTPTPTLEGQAYMVMPAQNSNCRQSNSNNSDIVDTLFEGTGYIPLGRGPDNLWMLFRGPVTNRLCWVATFLLDIPYAPLSEVPGEELPYFLYPTATSTPTQQSAPANTASPTPTCTPRAGTTGQSNC